MKRRHIVGMTRRFGLNFRPNPLGDKRMTVYLEFISLMNGSKSYPDMSFNRYNITSNHN